jgi:hypothetical protein
MFGMAGGSAGQFAVGPMISRGFGWKVLWIGMGIVGLAIGAVLFVLLPKDKRAEESDNWLKSMTAAFSAVFKNPQSILCGLIAGAGIGENSAEIRRRICEASSWLGLAINEKANTSGGPRISTRQSKVSVWVIPTNEELIEAGISGPGDGHERLLPRIRRAAKSGDRLRNPRFAQPLVT